MSTTTFNSFLQAWAQVHPRIPPLGCKLRVAEPFFWLRIHNLPCGKRYAESDSESSEILRRHKAAFGAVFESSKHFVVLAATQNPTQDKILKQFGFLPVEGWAADYRRLSADMEDDLSPFEFHIAKIDPASPGWNELSLAIADDKIDPILWVSEDGRRVYAPYDGGADLFFDSADKLKSARQQFKSWLSDQPSGL